MIGLFLSCSSSYHTPSSLLFFNVSLKSEKKEKKWNNTLYRKTSKSLGPLFFPLSFLPTLCCPFTVAGLVSTEQSSTTNNKMSPYHEIPSQQRIFKYELVSVPRHQIDNGNCIFFYNLENSDIGCKSYVSTSQAF